MTVCRECSAPLRIDATFCPHCGAVGTGDAPLAVDAPQPTAPAPAPEPRPRQHRNVPRREPTRKERRSRRTLIVWAVVLAVVAAVVAWFVLAGDDDTDEPAGSGQAYIASISAA